MTKAWCNLLRQRRQRLRAPAARGLDSESEEEAKKEEPKAKASHSGIGAEGRPSIASSGLEDPVAASIREAAPKKKEKGPTQAKARACKAAQTVLDSMLPQYLASIPRLLLQAPVGLV